MIIDALEDTQKQAEDFGKKLSPGDVVFLKGSLGAGKTTFVRYLLQALGYDGKVKSPTYTLVEQYSVAGFDVYHMDLYRLNDPFELEEMGWREYFHQGAVCLIEWPEKAGDYLPQPDWVVALDFNDGVRAIQVKNKDDFSNV
jgi:tRNA threonylcarbamoyladenosine biosynthesis protein TsaE